MPRNCGDASFRCMPRSRFGFGAKALALMLCCQFVSPTAAQVNGQPDQSKLKAEARVTTASAAPKPGNLLSSPVALEEALETKGDLTLQDATIEKALITIGTSWRVNIVVGKDVQGRVSCLYKQAPLREVLDAILLANGYSYRAVGKSLVVQKIQEVGSANPQFESAAISITHSDLQEILEGARLLLSKQGQIRALDSAKSILVVDYADRVASIRAFVSQMDAAAAQETGGIPAESYQRLQVIYFPVQYIPANSAREPINAVLSQAGRVATMPNENRIVVVDYPSNIAMVRRVLQKIDRPVPQVRITALIYDISLQDIEELGLNWLHNAGSTSAFSSTNSVTKLPFADVPFQPPGTVGTVRAAGSLGADMMLGSLSDRFSFALIGSFLQNANDARLLANPNVTVMENETAEMGSVQEIPFQQLTQSELGGQIGTTSFKEVGIKLLVTPVIAADGTVKLVMDQEFSTVVSRPEEGPPTVDTRIANTTVRVQNGHTLVIGGLRQRSDTGDFNGIPFLKDVKYIGPLFRSRNTIVRESELIVFLKPEIVSYEQAPSHREYMAQETVNCRLDRVPVAEGCGPCGNGPYGDACTAPTDGTMILESDVPPQHFPIDAIQSTPQANKLEKKPLRSNFGDRYRSTGSTNSNRRMIQESNFKATQAVKSDSKELIKLLRAGK